MLPASYNGECMLCLSGKPRWAVLARLIRSGQTRPHGLPRFKKSAVRHTGRREMSLLQDPIKIWNKERIYLGQQLYFQSLPDFCFSLYINTDISIMNIYWIGHEIDQKLRKWRVTELKFPGEDHKTPRGLLFIMIKKKSAPKVLKQTNKKSSHCNVFI